MSGGDAAAQRDALVGALRRYAAVHAGLMRAFARHLALHPTDATALAEIFTAEDEGRPLSPARLAARLGLSRPATTAALHRLEASGALARRADPRDRRAHTLHASPQALAETGRFFAALAAGMDATLAGMPPGEAARLAERLHRLADTVAAHVPPER